MGRLHKYTEFQPRRPAAPHLRKTRKCEPGGLEAPILFLAQNETGYPAAREYLGKARKAKRAVEQLEERLANLRMLITDTSSHTTRERTGHDSDQQKMVTLLAEIDCTERDLEEAKKKAEEIRLEVGMMICKLSDPITQKIMILHYLEDKNWNETAYQIHYSKRQVFRFRKTGYEEIQKMLHCESS